LNPHGLCSPGDFKSPPPPETRVVSQRPRETVQKLLGATREPRADPAPALVNEGFAPLASRSWGQIARAHFTGGDVVATATRLRPIWMTG